MSETATNGSTSGDARHCRLRVTAGLSNVSIQVGADMDGFLQARFRGEVPRVDVDGSEITIRSQRSGLDALRARSTVVASRGERSRSMRRRPGISASGAASQT
jgi:hypothetical protein